MKSLWTIPACRTRRAYQAGRSVGSSLIPAAFGLLFLVACVVSVARGDWTIGASSLLLLGMAATATKSPEEQEAEFQTTVLKGMETLSTKADSFQAETKKSLGELGAMRDAQTSLAEKVAAIERSQLSMRSERRLAGQVRTVRDVLNDEQKAVSLYMQICKAAGKLEAIQRLTEKNLVAKDLSSSSGIGAATVNNDLYKEIFDVLMNFGAWASLGVRRLGARTTKFPIKTARPTAQVLLTEGSTIARDTAYAGSSVNLAAEVIGVLLGVPIQLIEDDELDLVAEIMNDFLEAISERVDVLAFTATGASDATNGGMTGLFNFGTAITAATTHTSVGAMTVDDFVKCLTGVAPAVLNRQPKWWMHPTQIARVLTVKDGNGRPIFLNAMEAPSYGAIGTILGYPVVPVGVAPSTDGVSAKICAFGDPNAFVVGVRRDYEFKASNEAGFSEFETVFRGITRAGTKGRAATGIAVLSTAAS